MFVNQNVACFYRLSHVTQCLTGRVSGFKPEIIITERLDFFQVGGEHSTTLQQMSERILREDACTMTEREFCGIGWYGSENPSPVRGP
jgi:hypothetical protein